MNLYDTLTIQMFEKMSLTELIRLQNELSYVLTRRFERPLALAFSDIVDSTPYFARFGDEAGRKLQQRHLDLLEQVLPRYQGQIVNTAGDGAFVCFPTVERAVDALVELQVTLSRENVTRTRDHQLVVRTGIHYGSVLTDGAVVAGDAVNLCSRVTSTANGAEIRLTREAFCELSTARRLCCRALSPMTLKGLPRAVEILILEWRDRGLFPTAFLIEETGATVQLPDQDTIGCGRLRENEGIVANDVVLSLPDPPRTQCISRWHFELRRQPEGLFLRQVSDGITEVNGVPVPTGAQRQIRSGTKVCIGRVMTLTFIAGTGVRTSEAEEDTLVTP
jgi:Adenylate cyclase, family 3 (some proteins contain HAMP domain)